MPGIIAVIIMIVGALLTSLLIAREYENGTMETIRALPVGADEFFLGKAVPYFFITLVDVLVAILMGQVLFGVVMKSSVWLMILRLDHLHRGGTRHRAADLGQDQVPARGQPTGGAGHLPALAAALRFRVSPAEHAGPAQGGF